MVQVASRVYKGNALGVGFLRIPVHQRKGFRIDDYYKVTISKVNEDISFFGRIKDYHGKGIYVPKRIMYKYGLLRKTIEVELERVDGFHVSLSNDGKFRIPRGYRDMVLEHDDIILVSAHIEGKVTEKICRVKRSIYRNGEAILYCMFGPEFSDKKGIIKIIKKVKKPERLFGILGAFRDLNLGIHNDEAIIFKGHMVPIKVNPDIQLADISYHLGHFFADGTKRGNSWGICLSTFEQANIFIKTHKELVTDAKLNYAISYSGREKRKDISNIWERNTGIRAEKERFHKTDAYESRNRNEFGTLVVKEHRKLTQMLYNSLIDMLVSMISEGDNRNLAFDFICGVMEGDGSPCATKRGHIVISTNREDIKILRDVLIRTGLDFKIFEEKGNRIYIRVGALGILRNLPILKDRLFRYYPKRRKKFIERFLKVGAARYIMGKQEHASGWVKAHLRDNGILDIGFKPTRCGREVRECLSDMESELESYKNP